MLYHLALGAPGDGTPNAWDWSRTNGATGWNRSATARWAIRSAPFYPELPGPEAIRVPAACARPSACRPCRRSSSLRRPLPAGQPRPERLHRLHAAARLRERHAGFPAGPGRLRGADGPDHRLRVRPDADGRAARIPRHPFCRRLGHADRPDDFAGVVAATVQAALRPAVRPGPRTGPAHLVSLLRRISS